MDKQRCFLVVIELASQAGVRLDTARSSFVVSFSDGLPTTREEWAKALVGLEKRHSTSIVTANIMSITELPR